MLSLALLFVLVVLFSVFLALRSPRLDNREMVYVLLVHLFVYFARVNCCPFFSSFLALGVGCG